MNRTCQQCTKTFQPKYNYWQGRMVSSQKNCNACIEAKAETRWQRIKSDPNYLEQERARKREYYHRKKAMA